jgi:type I restriction enzyme R subunit
MLDLIFLFRQEVASFEDLGNDYEEKAYYDSLITVKEQSRFEFPDGENLELAEDTKAGF